MHARQYTCNSLQMASYQLAIVCFTLHYQMLQTLSYNCVLLNQTLSNNHSFILRMHASSGLSNELQHTPGCVC